MGEVLLGTIDLMILIFWPAATFGVSAAFLFWLQNRVMPEGARTFARRVGIATVVLAIVTPILLSLFVVLTASSPES